MELKRKSDWRSRLSAELESQRRFKLSYGQQDCFTKLVGGVVEALTGEDVVSQYAGTYSSIEEAIQRMKALGFKDVPSFTESLFPPYEHPSEAQIGDVGLVKDETELGYAYCIVDASSVIVLTDGGHGRLQREDMIKAYKVG